MRASFRPLVARCVVITGASSGLGAALARAYAAPGVALGLVARHRARLTAVAEACRASGATVEAAAIDVADRAPLEAWLAEFDRAHPVDLVIANAGISAGPEPGRAGEDIGMTTRQIAVNLLGAVHTVAPLVPAMAARGGGRIVADRLANAAPIASCLFARLLREARPASKAYGEALRAQLVGVWGRRHGGLSRLFRLADDRPMGRAGAAADRRRAGRPQGQAGHRQAAADEVPASRGRWCSACAVLRPAAGDDGRPDSARRVCGFRIRSA